MNSSRWFKMAALYFLIGSSIGLWMSIVHKMEFAPLHAHINLLGWVSMALIGAAYKAFPAMESSKLASAQFWLYQVGFIIFMAALCLILTGNPLGEQIIPIGSNLTMLGVLLTAIIIWFNAGSERVEGQRDRSLGA